MIKAKDFIKRECFRRSADDEPNKAELRDDIRIGLRQAVAGEGRPAREALGEIRRRIADDA